MSYLKWMTVLVGIFLLASCDNSFKSDIPLEPELPYEAMALSPESEVVDMSFSTDFSTQAAAALPDLNDTAGRAVAFEYTFSNGEKVNYMVQDGVVASGDMLLTHYNTLKNAVVDYENIIADGGGGTPSSISPQAAITKKYCKTRVLFCFDYDGDKWPNGVVTYEIPPATQFSAAEFQMIKDVMKEISTNTSNKITFKVGTSGDRIRFRSTGSGCNSWLGRAGGAQTINLTRSEGCITKALMRHEIGHALGFIHEHQRFDRDNYVTVNYNNIKSGKKDQFQKFNTSNLGIISGYDFNSVMHYSGSLFSKDPGKLYTIIRTRTGKPTDYIYVYSRTDYEYMRRYYP